MSHPSSCISTSQVCIAWAQVEVLETPTTTNREACGQPHCLQGKHNISRAVTSAAAASGRQPLSDLSCNICPFRPAQPSSLQQPSGLQRAPANTGKCPFAAPSQTKQYLAHQDTPEHQASALSTKNSLPASEHMLSTAEHAAGTTSSVAESASADGVDLAAVEAELDSFADTFAIHPDEALLHAYASLLADKVAEADSTSPCPETYVAAPKALDASEASRPRESLGCGQCTEATSALGSPAESGMQRQQSDCASGQGHSTGPSFTQEQNKDTRSDYQSKPQSDKAEKQHNPVTTPAHEQSSGGSLPSSSTRSLRRAHTQLPEHADDSSGLAEGTTGQAMLVPAGCWQHLLKVWDNWWGLMGQQTYTWHVMMVACFGAQLLMAAYLGLVHQRCATRIA